MSGKNILLPEVWGKILTQTHEITHTLVKVKWPVPNYINFLTSVTYLTTPFL